MGVSNPMVGNVYNLSRARGPSQRQRAGLKRRVQFLCGRRWLRWRQLPDLSGRGRKEKSVVLNKSDDSYKAGLLG
jgi:hypothetical protein